MEILYCLFQWSQPTVKYKHNITTRIFSFTALLLLVAASDLAAESSDLQVVGTLEDPRINEASGLQAGKNGVFFTHNDQKRDVFVVDGSGRHLGAFKLDGAKSKDWEDITRVPGTDKVLFVIADTGDNKHKRKDVELYFFEEPEPGTFNQDHETVHKLTVSYPEGPRDVESVAYDSSSESILILSKRDVPPRLYSIPLKQALAEKELQASFLTEVPGFRPPTKMDILSNPKRGMWVSQPTGMDISPDGRIAAVITYRSLYLFHRAEDETWAEAFRKAPEEIIGPPGTHDEAVAFSEDGKAVYVTTERRPAPIYRLELP